jgi:SAM-dependent methyltransferase
MSLADLHPWSVVRWTHRRLRAGVWELVDACLGVRTVYLERDGMLERDSVEYTEKPCGWITLWRAFHWLGVSADDALLDIGSGAGRAVLVASRFPFRRVVGVEREAWLDRQAQDNLARFRPRRRAPVDLVCADATLYPVPDDITVIFFYNPFPEPVMRGVMANVFASLERAPRRLRIVYVNPRAHEYLLRTGRCRLVATLMDRQRPSRAWARMLAAYVYEVDPARATDERAGRLSRSSLPGPLMPNP